SVIGAAEDREGYIWLSHNGGLTRISKDFSYARQFGVRDGLNDSEFNVGAALNTADGRILFGGNRGYNIIYPDILPGVGSGPRVSISQIRVMNERLPFDYREFGSSTPKVTLSHLEPLVEVEFFADTLSSPERVNYAYRLNGLTDEWIEGRDKHNASFLSLPPGNYTLQMAASSPTG
ncbi:unnamed protein product, partial [Ectocarpus sp. 12 AP-2014]